MVSLFLFWHKISKWPTPKCIKLTTKGRYAHIKETKPLIPTTPPCKERQITKSQGQPAKPPSQNHPHPTNPWQPPKLASNIPNILNVLHTLKFPIPNNSHSIMFTKTFLGFMTLFMVNTLSLCFIQIVQSVMPSHHLILMYISKMFFYLTIQGSVIFNSTEFNGHLGIEKTLN